MQAVLNDVVVVVNQLDQLSPVLLILRTNIIRAVEWEFFHSDRFTFKNSFENSTARMNDTRTHKIFRHLKGNTTTDFDIFQRDLMGHFVRKNVGDSSDYPSVV
jgi:hypothetical protein